MSNDQREDLYNAGMWTVRGANTDVFVRESLGSDVLLGQPIVMGSPAQFSYDPRKDTMEIYGIVYSCEVFRQLGGMLPVGATFRLAKREDGAITIETAEAKA